MKLRSTTPASISFPGKIVLVSLALFMAVVVPVQIMTHTASADEYDDKINALQSEVKQYQAESDRLSKEADTLQNELAKLSSEKAAIQTQIDLSQAQYDKLVADITATEKKIADNQDALGTTIANMYVDDDVTPIEMIASSGNISEFLDKQEYRASVRKELTATITKIKELKKTLSEKKVSVEDVLNKQKAQRNSLAANQAQQQSLLDQTKNQEAAYQSLISSNKQKMEEAVAAQKAYRASLNNGGYGAQSVVTPSGAFSYTNWSGNQGCSGGYPYCGGLDAYIDPWQLYNQECVSWAAWRIYSGYGKAVSGFHGQGMAYEWPTSAQSFSGAYQVSSPQPGDAVVLPATPRFAPVGHLMVVESVNSSEYPVHVSQYNMYGSGEYSTMDIKNSGVIFMRFRDR